MANATSKKKPTVKKVAKKAIAKKTGYQHFKLQKSNEAFMTVRLNMQSLYWLILMLFVAVIAAWIISLQMSINSIYDKIEEEQRLSSQIDQINQRIQENKKGIQENKAAINAQKSTQ